MKFVLMLFFSGSCSKVLLRAMELCKEETGKAEWPHIPEEYWEYAVREKGIEF